MTSMTFEYQATLDDGTTYVVVADQRDIAHFEIQPFGAGWLDAVAMRPFTFARFMAWSALTRAKKVAMTWEEWSTRCIQVDSTDEDEPKKPTDNEDPGLPAASAGI